MEVIKIDKFIVETREKIIKPIIDDASVIGTSVIVDIDKVLVYESCVNLIAFVFTLAGSFWGILGLVRFATALSQKSGPNLQASIWQIAGGFAVVLASFLFRTSNFDYYLVIKIFYYAHKLVIFAGAFWSLCGLVILEEGLKNSYAPNMESGIWQIVGGMIICCMAFLFKDILEFSNINK